MIFLIEGVRFELAFKDFKAFFMNLERDIPPVDLHWFFEISIRTEKKFS